MHHLLICRTCLGAATGDLAHRLRTPLGDGWAVTDGPCMGGCARPGAIAFQSAGKATYLFGDVPAEGAEPDILAFARRYAASPDGWIVDARAFGRLRTGSLARIPAAPDAQ